MRPTLTKAVAVSAEPETARYELKDTKVVGLRLIIQPSGAKSWAVRYTTPANEDRRFTLGSYPTIGLDDARKLADSVKRDVLVNRKDPAAEKTETRRKAAAGIDPDAMFTTAWASGRRHQSQRRGIKKAGDHPPPTACRSSTSTNWSPCGASGG